MNDADRRWLEERSPAWVPFALSSAVGHETFLSDDSSERRLSILYFLDRNDASLIAKAVFGQGTEGPPGHVHGGSIAALLDEAMAFAAWERGQLAVPADLRVRFKNLLPLKSRCLVRARVMAVEGPKITLSAVLYDDLGLIYAESSAVFLRLKRDKFGANYNRDYDD